MGQKQRNTSGRIDDSKRFRAFLVGVVMMALLFVMAGTAAAQTSVNDCQVVTSGEYEVTQDIEFGGGTCLAIVGNDTVIDGNGHQINGTPSVSQSGVSLGAVGAVSNVTVRNLTVSNVDTGFEIQEVEDVKLADSAAFSTNASASIKNSTDVLVENGAFTDTDSGIHANASVNVTVNGSLVQATPLFVLPPLPTLSYNQQNNTGVLLTDTQDSKITGSRVYSFGGPGVFINSTQQPSFTLSDAQSSTSSANEVARNEINNNQEGIRVVGSADNTITKNNVSSNTDEGISILPMEVDDGTILSTQSLPTSKNTVSHNTVTDNGESGILLSVPILPDSGEVVKNNTVQNNTVKRNEHGIQANFSSNNNITGNLIENNTEHGVWISGSADVSYSNRVGENVLVDNGESGVYLGGAGGQFFRTKDNIIVNNTVRGSEYGIWIGSSLNTTSRDNLVENNQEGIEVFGISEKSTFMNDSSRSSTDWDFVATDASTDTQVQNLNIGESTAENTTVSFEAKGVRLRSVDNPAENPNLENVSRFFNATGAGISPFLDVTVNYEESDLAGVNESTLRLTRNDGSGWMNLSDSSADQAANTVSANITSFSDFGIHGESDGAGDSDPTASFVYSPKNPDVGQEVTFDASGTEGTITSYEWDFDGDGNVEKSTALDLAGYSYPGPGDYAVTLMVVNDTGATDTTTQTVSVSAGGSKLDPGNPFGDANDDPVARSTVITRIVEWNTNNNDEIDGVPYTRNEIIGYIVQWNLARSP